MPKTGKKNRDLLILNLSSLLMHFIFLIILEDTSTNWSQFYPLASPKNGRLAITEVPSLHATGALENKETGVCVCDF